MTYERLITRPIIEFETVNYYNLSGAKSNDMEFIQKRL